jgi:hypothetical protein
MELPHVNGSVIPELTEPMRASALRLAAASSDPMEAASWRAASAGNNPDYRLNLSDASMRYSADGWQTEHEAPFQPEEDGYRYFRFDNLEPGTPIEGAIHGELAVVDREDRTVVRVNSSDYWLNDHFGDNLRAVTQQLGG